MGLALLLRQAWVFLTWQAARAWGLRPSQDVPALRLARLGEWLADELKRRYREEKQIHLGIPLLPLGNGLL